MNPQRRRPPAGLVLCLLAVLGSESAGVRAQASDYSGTWKLDKNASRIAPGVGITGLGAGGAPPTLYISQAANGTVVVGSAINESHARTFKIVNGAIANEGSGVKEIVSVSTDLQTLTVKVMATPTAGEAVTTTLVYTKATGEDPCEKWPTPCRYDPRK